MVGQTISHYTVIERLGSGGMGEIYKAQDLRLNRFVAIKALSSASAGDPERRRRFIQEAQAASALNHPNIITIYDIVSQDGLDFMVMEYIAGSTLAELVPKEGMQVALALSCAVQMADALATAHAAGIIHRDLKPGNVMVTGSGLVKILDFGLAKLIGPSSVEQTDETAPITAPLTVEGSILGTVSYMSPEQAEARRVDARSDIFTFGLVLYEMLTGAKAFAAGSVVSTLSKILRDEAKPISQAVRGVPPELERIINRAMRKDPDQRWQTMREMHAELAALKQRLDSSILMKPPAAARKKPATALALAAAGLVVVAGLAGGAWWFKHRVAAQIPAAPAQLALTAPAPPVAPPAEVPAPAGALPDGSAATAGTASATPPPEPPQDAVLTNQAVLDMLQGKVPVSAIIGQIRSSKTKFDLTPAELILLTKNGATGELLAAMRNPRAATYAAPKSTAPTPATVTPKPLSEAPAAPASAAVSAPPEAPRTASPVTTPPPAAEHIATRSRPVTVAAGTPLSIALTENVLVNPTPGQALHFTVSKDFRVGDSVIVAKGTPLSGQIVETGSKVLLIKKGKATFRVFTVAASDGSKLAIRAAPGRRAPKIDAPIEASGHHDKERLAPAGSQYEVYVDGDQTVNVRQ